MPWLRDKWKTLYLHFHKGPWLPNLARRWLRMEGPHQQSRLVTNVISLLSQGLWSLNLAGWWLRTNGPTHKVTWHFHRVVPWKIKNIFCSPSKSVRPTNLAGSWIEGEDATQHIMWQLNHAAVTWQISSK